ncbi:hypothetical protein T265_12236 [Opisthorchis viverrini]|uniref:Uncharacterized protein n=1 Tax=Opisthorchis viverrini TaxID=6198 RepID=A0A074Z5G2_OPIVI|nr:hypothetical protein T265_12236 [Opisthorchis viverrini]KER18540.1 hypothetical protein T265_12236 [Opisthorchis viverrini]
MSREQFLDNPMNEDYDASFLDHGFYKENLKPEMLSGPTGYVGPNRLNNTFQHCRMAPIRPKGE